MARKYFVEAGISCVSGLASAHGFVRFLYVWKEAFWYYQVANYASFIQIGSAITSWLNHKNSHILY